MANKENILKTDDFLKDVTDKLETLNLGEHKSSPKKKFNLNVWSTPLKAVGNIRHSKENVDSTATAPHKLTKSIPEESETSLDEEEKISVPVVTKLFENDQHLVKSGHETQQKSFETNQMTKCSETSSEKFEDCASTDDVSDDYIEEYESANSSHSETCHETRLSQYFGGIDSENLNDLSQFLPDELNETRDMIERYLEGSLTFVGSASHSQVDLGFSNEVISAENVEEVEYNVAPDDVQEIYESVDKEQAIRDQLKSSEIHSQTLPVIENNPELDLTGHSSLTEILSDLLDNIDDQDASGRFSSTQKHECLTTSFLSKEFKNIENSVEKNTNTEMAIQRFSDSSEFVAEVNEPVDSLIVKNESAEDMTGIDKNTSIPEMTSTAEEIKNQANLEKEDVEIVSGNSSLDSLTVEKLVEEAVVCDISIPAKYSEQLPNEKMSISDEINFSICNDNMSNCEIKLDVVREPMSETLDSGKNNVIKESTALGEKLSEEAAACDISIPEKFNEQQDANTSIPENKTTTVQELVNEKLDCETNNAGIICENTLTFVDRSYEEVLPYHNLTEKSFSELQIDANTFIPKVKTDRFEEITNQTFCLENNDARIIDVNPSLEKLTEKYSTHDIPAQEEFSADKILSNSSILEVKEDTVEQIINETADLETNVTEIMHENSSFVSLTSFEKSAEKSPACDIPTEAECAEKIHTNTSIPQVKINTAEQMLNQTVDLQNNVTETMNVNSSFGLFIDIESPKKTVTCDIQAQEECSNQQISVNTSVLGIKSDTTEESTNQLSQRKSIEMNGNLPFGSLTAVEELSEELTACDIPIQDKFSDLHIDLNTSVYETVTDTVEQSTNQQSDLEKNDVEIMHGTSSGLLTFDTKLGDDNFEQTSHVIPNDALLAKNTHVHNQHFVEAEANSLVLNMPAACPISDDSLRSLKIQKLTDHFNEMLSPFRESLTRLRTPMKRSREETPHNIPIQDRFDELYIDLNTSIYETVTDTTEQPKTQLSNLKKNETDTTEQLKTQLSNLEKDDAEIMYGTSSGLLAFGTKLSDNNFEQSPHVIPTDVLLAEDTHVQNQHLVKTETISSVLSTPAVCAISSDSLRSTKIQKLKDHFNEILSPFRENLIRLRTPMKKNGEETPRQSCDQNTETNRTTKIVFEIPGSILDLSIGELESLTNKKLTTALSTDDDAPVDEFTSLVSAEVDDVMKSSGECLKSRKLDFEKSNAKETEDPKIQLQKELDELKQEFLNFVMDHESLLQKYEQLRKDYEEKQNEIAKLSEISKKMLPQIKSLQKGIKEYEDIARFSNNKYELLKEYSTNLIAQMNEEMEKKEKEINVLKSKLSE